MLAPPLYTDSPQIIPLIHCELRLNWTDQMCTFAHYRSKHWNCVCGNMKRIASHQIWTYALSETMQHVFWLFAYLNLKSFHYLLSILFISSKPSQSSNPKNTQTHTHTVAVVDVLYKDAMNDVLQSLWYVPMCVPAPHHCLRIRRRFLIWAYVLSFQNIDSRLLFT